MAAAILPKQYELSIVIIGDKESRRLNKTHHHRGKVANILSFPLSKEEGELFLNPTEARRDAPRFGFSEKKMLHFLVIHGLLHLKGHRHGATMSQAENKLLKRFSA